MNLFVDLLTQKLLIHVEKFEVVVDKKADDAVIAVGMNVEIENDDSEDSDSVQNDVPKNPTKRKKGEMGKNFRKINIALRMQGSPYSGYSRIDKQFTEGVPREERKMGKICSSGHCKKSNNRHCEKFSERTRKIMFENF